MFKGIGCQSDLPLHTAVTSDHLKHATDYFEWKVSFEIQ
jgi:hypothetical protein